MTDGGVKAVSTYRVEGHLRDMTAENAEKCLQAIQRVLSDERYPDRVKLFVIVKSLEGLEVDE